ncbi:MAG: hypothetical protein ACLGGX_06030 [Bdellovibrionia bacterium]
MKKLILIAATIATAASPAFASKARQTALSDSRQINDFQQSFERPYLFGNFGTMATFEWGTSQGVATNAVDPHAEGGFLVNNEGSFYGLYFGRTSKDFNRVVSVANNQAPAAAKFLYEQNPINVIYGQKASDLTWGLTFKYSAGKNVSAIPGVGDQESSTMGLAAGAAWDKWEAELVLGLGGKSKNDAAELKSKANTKVGVGYNLDESSHVFADYKMTETDAGGTDVKGNALNIGYINTLVKSEDANVFYGIKYASTTEEIGTTKTETSTLPVWIGVEAAATSWMTLRASASQSVLINETKTGGAKSDLDSITFAAGAGFKLGKGMLDATFATANQGQLSFSEGSGAADKFLSNVSYTYMF